MQDFQLSPSPKFRANATDQAHAATIARHIRAAGLLPTPTVVMRVALAKAAEALSRPTPDTGL